ncbi:zeta toxin family protein, partial [Oleiphilus sp. HI0123]
MSDFTEDEQGLVDAAIKWAKERKKHFVQEYANKDLVPADTEPTAYYMAGCPAAGKTEVAHALKRVLDDEFKDNEGAFSLIDPDEIREQMPGYNGKNARLFQYPTSIIVDAVFDKLMKNKQSFILDGTLSDYDKTKQNIERCLSPKRDYCVVITFVYNDPLNAWKAAKARELTMGRAIDLDVFVDRYFKSKDTVRKLKEEFGQNLQVDLLFKDLDQKVRPEFNIGNIDNYLDEKYTPASLREALDNTETE